MPEYKTANEAVAGRLSCELEALTHCNLKDQWQKIFYDQILCVLNLAYDIPKIERNRREVTLWEVQCRIRMWLDGNPKSETMVKSGAIKILEVVEKMGRREPERLNNEGDPLIYGRGERMDPNSVGVGEI